MEVFKISNLSFKYPKSEKNTLDDISFSVEAGEFITLCGASGCGKSTLLKQLKSVLRPAGELSGEIYFENHKLNDVEDIIQAENIGFVSQSADNQIVTDKVWHELAFGMESLGYESGIIRQRVSEMASFFGIQKWFYKNVNELSGGQKQILCLASIMTMLPKVVILDEPTSQLDPIAASEFINMLVKINRELGITIIITEHRLEEIIPVSNRVIVMQSGRIIANDIPEKVCQHLKQTDSKMLMSMPVPIRVWFEVESRDKEKCPLTVNKGRNWLLNYMGSRRVSRTLSEYDNSNKEIAVNTDRLWFKYEKNGDDILKGVSLTVNRGDIFSLLGGNGTGKSTLLSVICGLRKPYRGKVTHGENRIIMLPQNPASLFVKKTVAEELEDISGDREKINEIVKICELEQLSDRHPYDLSGGEQQRTALAKVLLLNPDVLLLDEPTKGLDNYYKEKLGNVFRRLTELGKTIIMVSHDVEFCGEYSDKCALFFDGNIVNEDTPEKFFSGNSFYTTSANRMARGIIDNAVTAGDIIEVCKKKDDSKLKICNNDIQTNRKNDKNNCAGIAGNKNSIEKPEFSSVKKINVIMSIIIVLAIPFTLFAGVYFFDDRKYLFISLVVMLECMMPFFLMFEGKSPKVRELVMISVICALCVAGRMVFYMFPEFKPVVAMVVISGAVLGKETGFLVGAITMLVSNIVFGQGPWTPWQMFAMGVIGFLSGLLFNKKSYGKNRLILAVYGLVSAVVIYGGIMNPAAAVMAHSKLNKGTIISYYVSGFPVDLVRGVATVIFVFLLAKPVIEKVERIKEKYAL